MTGSIEVLLPTQLMGVLIAIASQQKKTDIIAFITIDTGLMFYYSLISCKYVKSSSYSYNVIHY